MIDVRASNYNKWLHRYTILVVITTAILIYAGGLVTTLGAGLAVPDWPLSFGSLNPAEWWKKPMVREEHGHRLIGATVGLMTLIMTFTFCRSTQARWLKRLAAIALLTVVIQGILGGLRVTERNIVYAMIHACVGQSFFCVLVALAWGTSRSWIEYPADAVAVQTQDRRIAIILCAVIFVQLVIGAIMRHSGAGMAIPTFPLVFGGLLPPEWTLKVGVHYAHRVGAVAVFVTAAILLTRSFRGFEFWLRFWTVVTFNLIVIQIFLGASVIWSGRSVIPTTAHVLLGALILASSLSTVLWSYRSNTRVKSITN